MSKDQNPMTRTQSETRQPKRTNDSAIDLSEYRAVMEPEQVAEVMGVTVGSLANDRFRGVGIPYTKHGNRIRYLRADVRQYLLDHR
jgi:hypothetical protein